MKILSGEEFDELADSGEDISDYLDWDKATRGDSKRITLDIPNEFLAALDREANLRGITRQSLIKGWLYDRLLADGVKITDPITTSEVITADIAAALDFLVKKAGGDLVKDVPVKK